MRHRRRSGGLIAGLLALAGVAACGGSATGGWPTEPEALVAAVGHAPDEALTCGGRPFPAAGLVAPTGAEIDTGPEFDALRQGLARFGSSFPDLTEWTWQLAGIDATGATFLARTSEFEEAPWVSLQVVAGATDSGAWAATSMGYCEPRVAVSAGYGPARWALDPAADPPRHDSTELRILVWEIACSGGRPTTGRMSAPVIDSTTASVTVTLGVQPINGASTCDGPPGTPAVVRLGEPLGERTLLDGSTVPPASPAPPTP